MRPILFDLNSAEGVATSLCRARNWHLGEVAQRQFPDGESYVRLLTPVAGLDVILLCTLDRPDPKIPRLLFAAAAAREQGARTVGLIAPYLAYMRQDRAFHPGEAVTSKTLAEMISERLDWLVTVDPHLHRYPSLKAIYPVPAVTASASEAIANWIRREIAQPVLIGPDRESGQWVQKISQLAGARCVVLEKRRHGDLSVSVQGAGLASLGGSTPVIVDDIASSAGTMIETVRLVRRAGLGRPTCIVVHAIFAGDAYDKLIAASPERIVSTNTVAHSTNQIDVSDVLATATDKALSQLRPRPLLLNDR